MNIKIKIGDEYKNLNVYNLQIISNENEHAKCKVEFSIVKNQDISEMERLLGKERIAVYYIRHGMEEILFSGYYEKYILKELNDVYVVELEAYTYTKRLDLNMESRSYQDIRSSHYSIMQRAIEKYSKVLLVNNTDNIAVGKCIIQYQETPWDFIVRMSSECGKSVFVNAEYELAYIHIGADKKSDSVILEGEEINCGIDNKYFLLGGPFSNYDRYSFLFYEVLSEQNISIGSRVEYKNMDMVVSQKHISYTNEEWKIRYKVNFPSAEIVPIRKNEKIAGLSLAGTVIATNNENIKVHFDIDKEQDVVTAYEYEWTPITGNLLYCMPEIGTKVNVYFSSAEESSAKAIASVRKNGKTSTVFYDVTDRGLVTQHNKRIQLNSTELVLSSEGKKQWIELTDEGIKFISGKNTSIIANEALELKANNYSGKCVLEMNCIRTNETVSEQAICAAKTTLSMNGETNCCASFDIFRTTREPLNNSFFQDNPTEVSEWELLGDILVGVAIGALAVVAVVGVLALAGATGGVLLGAAVGGMVALGVAAYDDWKDGNRSSLGSYFCKGLSGAVSGALWGGVSPVASYSSSFLKYVGQSIFAGVVSGGADSMIENMLGKMMLLEGYEDVNILQEATESAFWGGITGGIFGAFSLGTRMIFSDTLFKMKGANQQQVARCWHKIMKYMKCSYDEFMGELRKVYGNGNLYKAFAKDPLKFFVNCAEGYVMPGKWEAAIVPAIISAFFDECTEEDDAEYVEDFILRPASE